MWVPVGLDRLCRYTLQEPEAVTHHDAPASLAALRQKAERFSTVIDPARIAQVALSYES